MKILHYLFSIGLLAASLVACQKAETEDPVFPPSPEPEPEVALEPAECNNNVVAHRCGAKEITAPDNSLEALKYAKKLGCFAVECDIYYTKDNNVIVHHGSDGKVNGLHPSQNTLAQIRAAGKLSNGEQIPTLEDFIKVVCVKGCCTRLWLETKNITNDELTSTEQETAIVNGFKRAMDIVLEKKAQNFVAFNGTGRKAVFNTIYPMAKAKGFKMSIASTATAASMKSSGYAWASYDITDKTDDALKATVSQYKTNGIELSMYCFDTDAQRTLAKQIKGDVKGLLTNYPSKLLSVAF